MKTYTIDFYDKFNCIAQDCPNTCCKGWGLLVDDNTYANMRKQKGVLGVKFRLFTKVDVENGAILKTIGGRCPFLERDGLCQLQKKGDPSLIADVCNLYPRRSITYGDFCEVSLELSCEHVVNLFLQDIRRHQFIEAQADIKQMTPYYAVMNNAPDFLEHVMHDRERILSYLWEKDQENAQNYGIFPKMKDILEYTYAKQSYFGRDDEQNARKLVLPISKEEKQRIAKEGYKELNEDFIFDVSSINTMIYNRLTFTCTKSRNRVIYDFIESYKKQFGRLYENQADAYFKNCVQKLLREKPQIEEILVAYFSYLLQQTYGYTYETYYFIGPILLAAMSTQFVLLVMVVMFLDGQSLEREKLAAVIAGVERALRHSKTTEQEILELFRKGIA